MTLNRLGQIAHDFENGPSYDDGSAADAAFAAMMLVLVLVIFLPIILVGIALDKVGQLLGTSD